MKRGVMLFEFDNMRDGYVSLVDAVVTHGRKISPRGVPTREISHCTIVLKDPYDAVPVGVRPGLRLEIGAAETVQLLAGVSDAAQLTNITSVFRRFTLGDRLLGAYGPRVVHQMENVLRRLVADESSRQASLQIWRPNELELSDNPDVPCTIDLHWMIRDGRLDMLTHMRSNDVFLGVPYDFMVFTRLQLAVAWALGVPVGEYHHLAWSLHIYDRDIEKLNNITSTSSTRDEHPPPIIDPRCDTRPGPRSIDRVIARWRRVRTFALACVLDKTHARSTKSEKLPTSARWYYDILHPYRSGNRLCQSCYYVLPVVHFDHRKTLCLQCIGRGLTARSWAARRRGDLLSHEEYESLLKKQGSKCAVCGGDGSNGRWSRLCVDHDHVTGHVRGLLCDNCNKILGLSKDDPIRLHAAAEYVKRTTLSTTDVDDMGVGELVER